MSDEKPYKLPLKRRVFQSAAVQALAAVLMAYLLKLLWFTFRKQVVVHPQTEMLLKGDKPLIFCLWHGRMIIFPFFKPKHRRMRVLISHHRDGELIARLIRHFGVQSVRGSSSKGAKEATSLLLQSLANGDNIAITPDGPRGPAFAAQRGALHLARLSGCDMIPVSFSASPCTQLSSWDRFIIPHPFARVRVEIAAPIHIAKDAKLDGLKQAKQELETALNAAGDRADAVRTDR